jgi:hypothetical protein
LLLSFPLVGNPSISLLWERGEKEDFTENVFIQKIPSSPLCQKGIYTKKDSGQAGMTTREEIHNDKERDILNEKEKTSGAGQDNQEDTCHCEKKGRV